MVRRLVLLMALIGVAWLVFSRLRRSSADDWDDDEPGDSWYGHPRTAGSAEPSAERSVAGYVAADLAREPATTTVAGPPAVEAPALVGEAPAATGTAVGAPAAGTGPVKGNVRAGGEKIYHMPGDPAYERTNAETMFASAEDAEAAGFRRAGRPRG